ncbi:MAG TPA: M1 family aminopeptidase [Pyrinomonadaceae bacterium]|jgi:hypothetical protein
MKIKNLFVVFSVILCFAFSARAQDPQPSPTETPRVVGEVTIKATKANIDPVYTELRKLSEAPNAFSGEYASVNNLVLKRDAATFTLRSGEMYFLAPAQGKTTGAVFIGDGEISLTPPVNSEKKMLNFFIESPELKEQFSQLVIFFTDETFDEIKKSAAAKMSTAGAQATKARDAFREKETMLRNRFRYNMTARILMDAYAPPRPGFFTSFIEGKKYSKLVYQLDPLGIAEVSPEQVMLLDYSEAGGGIWTAFHLADEYKKGTATSSQDRRVFDLAKHEIDVTLRGTKLLASDKVTMTMRVPGQRVLPFDLYPTLKVKRVFGENGEEINIIQESSEKDGSLAVILPAALEVGKPFVLNFEYEGDGVLINRGSGNYILNPAARASWYPNNGGTQFGDRANFDITFRYPKQMVMVGVGELVKPEQTEGDLKVSAWSTKGVEMAVAGFNYGDFTKKEFKDDVTGYTLEVFVNKDVPNEIKSIQRNIERAEAAGIKTETTLGSFSTSSMAEYVLGETQNSTRIYHAYFGKLPFNRIAMTQQPAVNFGQAWATLIYMPYMAFIDSTQRTQLFGIGTGTAGFWREVAPHEVAHQWWGHSSGWTSYHDQWMSEGFAELSTSLYIQFVKKDIKKFNEFWEEQRKQIVEASPRTKGLKPYTVGPVTQGYRLNTARTGGIAQNLIYPKGAYILHMIRMMMNDRKEGDAKFQVMMRDFIKTHYNKDVSTEDFKAIVEKHITPKMDIDKNGKMDWFFDQWVYGTEVPAYKLEYNINKADGKVVLSGKITQSGVSDNFVMPVPLYIDFGNGWVSAGDVTIVGNKSFDLGNIALPREPKKVAICALSDVLATSIDNVKK